MRISFTTDFKYGDEVYLKTDPEVKRVVSGFLLRKKSVVIGLVRGEDESWHQECELIKPKIIKVRGFGKDK